MVPVLIAALLIVGGLLNPTWRELNSSGAVVGSGIGVLLGYAIGMVPEVFVAKMQSRVFVAGLLLLCSSIIMLAAMSTAGEPVKKPDFYTGLYITVPLIGGATTALAIVLKYLKHFPR